MRPNRTQASRAPAHPPSLQRFTLEELAPFTKEGAFASNASRDFHLFYVGRDDVHGILRYLLSRATMSLYLNMFGYDDEELSPSLQGCRWLTASRDAPNVSALGEPRSSGVVKTACFAALLAASSVTSCRDYPEAKAARWQELPGGGRSRIGPPEPDCYARGTAEVASWVEARYGARVSPSPEADVGMSLGTEATFPVAWNENFRIGPWAQVGSDAVDWIHASGGVAFLLGNLHDPMYVPKLAGTHDEGAIELRLGTGWRGVGTADRASNGATVSAKLTFGSRRYMETVEGYNAFDVCDGSAQGKGRGEGAWVGHYGLRYAYGARVFVEVEQDVDSAGTQLVAGVEIDPVTIWRAQQESNVRGASRMPRKPSDGGPVPTY